MLIDDYLKYTMHSVHMKIYYMRRHNCERLCQIGSKFRSSYNLDRFHTDHANDILCSNRLHRRCIPMGKRISQASKLLSVHTKFLDINSNICHFHIDSRSDKRLLCYKHTVLDHHIRCHSELVNTLQMDFRSIHVDTCSHNHRQC